MLIYIGADHRGYNLKEKIKQFLSKKGYTVVDEGNDHYDESDDYPDFASRVAVAVVEDPDNRRGILICGSGIGTNIVANKIQGIRAAKVDNSDQAFLSRKDTDCNVLSLGADFLEEEEAKKILSVWLMTPFSGEERHKRRIRKIGEIEIMRCK